MLSKNYAKLAKKGVKMEETPTRVDEYPWKFKYRWFCYAEH